MTLGRIGIVGFAREQELRRAGDGLLTTSETPVPASGAGIVQGALEGSNVKPIMEMTTMLETDAGVRGRAAILDTEHELERQAIERIGSDRGLTMMKGELAKQGG